MLIGVGERMIQFRIGKTPGMVRPRQGEEGRRASGEFEQGLFHDLQCARRPR
jgi:hypothetical protein